MTQLVLMLLAAAWIAVLAPDVARLFRPRRRVVTSVDEFRQQLDSLGRSAPVALQIPQQGSSAPGPDPRSRLARPPTAMPATPGQAAVRRRDIGTLLAVCVGVTLAGLLATRSLWALAALVAMLGVATAYAAGVVRRHRAAPTAQVHYLPTPQPGTTSSTVTMVRRTVNE